MLRYRSILLAATALMAHGGVLAQEAPADVRQGAAMAADGQAIVVTARRREEALQDVPISITAVSGESLAQSGVSDALGFQSRIPSLSLSN